MTKVWKFLLPAAVSMLVLTACANTSTQSTASGAGKSSGTTAATEQSTAQSERAKTTEKDAGSSDPENEGSADQAPDLDGNYDLQTQMDPDAVGADSYDAQTQVDPLDS